MLTAARATTTFVQKLNQLKKFDLLILDDWGIEPFTARTQSDLLELIESRLDTGSCLITSQLPMSVWYEAFDNKTVADAVMDRVIHGSYYIQLSGESLRKAKRANTKPSR